MQNFTWNQIRPIQNSLNLGFEELICQLARIEYQDDGTEFIRKGTPDAGLECFWIFNDNKEIGWQSKFFLGGIKASQISQIKRSAKNALLKHPNLKHLIFALPIDPPDARSGTISLLDRMQEVKCKFESLYPGVKVEFWWSSDIISRLQKKENRFLFHFWFNQDYFSPNWFINQNAIAINALGVRYSPQVNVSQEDHLMNYYNAFIDDDKYKKKILDVFDSYLLGVHYIINNFDFRNCEHEFGTDYYSVEKENTYHLYDKDKRDAIEEDVQYIISFLNAVDILVLSLIGVAFEENIRKELGNLITIFESINSHANNLIKTIEGFALRNYYYSEKESDWLEIEDEELEEDYYVYDESIKSIREIVAKTTSQINCLKSDLHILNDSPILLVTGDAGVGKSHLLADFIRLNSERNVRSILLLGHQFNSTRGPYDQILNILELNMSIKTFLESLNHVSQIDETKTVIIIDALNEGAGPTYWNNYLSSFCSRIEEYPYLALALSVRSSYKNQTIPQNLIKEKKLIEYEHKGFKYKTNEAIQIYFDHYNIPIPNIPILKPEFQHPLFLKLFCESYHDNKISLDKYEELSLGKVIDNYLLSVNKTIGYSSGYDPSLLASQKCVKLIIKSMVANQVSYLKYEDAYLICSEQENQYRIKNSILEALINESVLFKETNASLNCEVLQFSYERLRDYLVAEYLLHNKDHSLDRAKYQSNKSSSNGLLEYVLKTDLIASQTGVIECLYLLYSENNNGELSDLFDELTLDTELLNKCFLWSLYWRSSSSITSKTIEVFLKTEQQSQRPNYKALLRFSLIEESPLNIMFLHDRLMKLSVKDRDEGWSRYVTDDYNSNGICKLIVESLIMTSPNQRSEYTNKAIIKLLSWFLSTPDLNLRNNIINLLVYISRLRLCLVINVIKDFIDVDDMYILSGLADVAYSIFLQSADDENRVVLRNFLESKTFKKMCTLNHFRIIQFTLRCKQLLLTKMNSYLPSTSFIENKIIHFNNFPLFDDSQTIFITSGLAKINKLSSLPKLQFYQGEYCYDSLLYNKNNLIKLNAYLNDKISILQESCSNSNLSYNKKMYLKLDLLLRSGDTTFTINMSRKPKYLSNLDFWDYDTKMINEPNWDSDLNDIPSFNDLLNYTIGGVGDFFCLYRINHYESEYEPGLFKIERENRGLYFHQECFLVDSNNLADIVSHMKEMKAEDIFFFMQQYIGNMSFPLSNGIYYKEYYWSLFYKAIFENYNSKIVQTNKSKIRLYTTSNPYFKFINNDNVIRHRLPSDGLFNGSNLAMNSDLTFTRSDGKLMSFDPSIYNECSEMLLYEKKCFVDYLKSQNLKAFWIVAIKKERDHYNYLFDPSKYAIGVYFLNDNSEIVGSPLSFVKRIENDSLNSNYEDNNFSSEDRALDDLPF